MNKQKSMDMLNGPMLGKILMFALPLALSSILQLLFNAADTIIVGKFAGNQALAAVGSNGALINLIVNAFFKKKMNFFKTKRRTEYINILRIEALKC